MFASRLSGWLVAVAVFVAAGEGDAAERCFLPGSSLPARCGTVAVALRHDAPESGSIDVHYVVVPALEASRRLPDPVFFLAGGPGQSAIRIAPIALSSLREVRLKRDVVFVDQRGTGRSAPLECEVSTVDQTLGIKAFVAAMSKCVAGFEHDVRDFTTAAFVADLEQVRKKLDYERVNLYGGSYGTRVAQVYLREHPDVIRSAVLDGVAPMELRVGLEMGTDAQPSLEALFRACAQEKLGCGKAFPRLPQRFNQLLADLRETPRTVAVADPMTGEPLELEVDGDMVAGLVRFLLYARETRRLLPVAIGEASRGRLETLVRLGLAASAGAQGTMSLGLLFAVLCAEDLAGLGPDAIPDAERASFLGPSLAEAFLGVCAQWPSPRRVWDRRPLETSSPVLLLSGRLDPVTPPSRAEAAQVYLQGGVHVVVAEGAHIVAGLGCVPELMADFFDDPRPTALDAACAREIEGTPFFTSVLGPGVKVGP